MSKRKKKMAFMDKVIEIVGDGAECSVDDLRRVAALVDLGISEFQPTLEQLREQGFLCKRGNGGYKIVASCF